MSEAPIHHIRLEPAGGQFSCRAGQTVLEAAAEAGYWLPHSCRTGSCGSCAMPVLAGQFHYRSAEEGKGEADAATLQSLAPGQFLACQAVPDSDMRLDAPGVPAEPGRRIVKALARVQQVERVSADVVVVKAQVPPATGWGFEAGQYADLILKDGSRRCYSMANAPNDKGEIEWHIRRIEGGRFSPHAYDALKPRDMLRIEGPFGSFTLQGGDAPVLLLASGTGYAPIASFLHTHLDELARRGAVLYWGGRQRQDLYALGDEASWQARYPGVRVVPVFSDAPPQERGRRGLVHQAVLEDWPDLSRFEVYACGNPLMVEAARQSFVQAGLAPERFFSDAFVFQKA